MLVKSELLRELEKEIVRGPDYIGISVDTLLNKFPIGDGKIFKNKKTGEKYVLFNAEIINFIESALR